MADPFTAFFAAVGSSIGGTAGAFLIMNAQALAYASLVVGSIATGNYQKRKMEQRARDAYNASLEDRKVMIRSGTAPSPVVYGETRLSGPIVHAQSTGDKEQYLHLVVAFTRHELNAFKTIYFGDVALPQENVTTGLIESGSFAFNEYPDKTVAVTTNGSGVATLPDIATKVISAANDAIFSFDSGYTAYSFSHTPPSNTVTGLPPNTTITITYEYGVATPKVKIRRHLGGAGQVADADLVADSGGQWTANDVGVNTAYLYVRLEWHNDVFGQIGVPNISALVQGKKVYDPRSGLTVYSNNAALCTADYLKDTRFGIRATSAEVPNSEIITAANICDEDVVLYNTGTVSVVNGAAAVIGSGTSWLSRVRPGYTFIGPNAVRYTVASVLTNALLNLTTNYGGTTQSGQAYSVVQPRYTVNGSLGSDVSPLDNLNHLTSAMAGTAVFVQGRWLVRAGAHITPTLTIDANALGPGSVTILPRRGRADLFNGVWGKFFDRDILYAENEYPVVTSSAYESEDGEQVLIQMDYPLVDDAVRSVRLSTVELNRSRQALTVQLTTNYRAYDLVPSDTVYVTLSKYGFNSKQFIVLDRVLDMATGLIKYVLRETASTIWDWTFTAIAGVDPAPNTDLPSWLTTPSLITGLAVDSGTSQLIRLTDGTVVSRALVSWTAPNDQFVLKGGRIEVRWKMVIQDAWELAGLVPGDQTSIYISPVPDGRPITVAVRAISSSDIRGPWQYLTGQVVGKTALPSDVSGFTVTKTSSGLTITWANCPDLDYDITILKTGASWAAGTILTAVKGNRFDWSLPPVGAITVWAKHYDTTGNESNTAASSSVTVTTGDFASGGDNLVLNSSFEIDSNSDGLADGWEVFVGGAGDAGRVHNNTVWTGGNPRHGTYLQEVQITTATNGNDTGLRCVPVLPIKPSTKYVLSASIYASVTGKVYLAARAYDAGSATVLDVASSLLSPVSTWERKSIAFTTPSNAASLEIYVRGITANGEYMRADAVMLQEGEVATAYVQNVAEIADAAAAAQSTADGKIVTFVQASTPTATAVGDLWFDSDDGYKLYRAGAPGTGSWTAYQFGTGAVAPGAATPSVQSSQPANNTHSWGSGSGAVPPQQQIGVLSYTNNTGRTVDVEMTATLNALGSGGTGTAGGVPCIQTYCDDGSSELASRKTFLTATSAMAGGALHVQIANGVTINFRLYSLLSITSSGTWNAGSITWTEASMRMTVIAA